MSKKEKIMKILLLVICSVLLIILTGCKAENKEDTKQTETSSQEEQKQEVQAIEIDRTEDFDGDFAVVKNTVNFETTNYIIDKNFKVLFSYKNADQYKDGYVIIPDENEENKMYVKDCNGNTVFSYNKITDYEEIKLLSDGLMITKKQTDTYNSSLMQTGIYDLKEQKYVLEPNEKYNEMSMEEAGDNMIALDGSKKVFFNMATRKVVEYQERVPRDFKDGYSVDTDLINNEHYLKVFDMEGNVKTIKSLYDMVNNIKEASNGMLIDSQTRIERENYSEQITGTDVQLFDLEKGTVKSLSDQFIMLENKPNFTKDGYALVKFSNQGDETYYTVIDKEGNLVFEPQKRNNEASFGAKTNGVPRIIKSENLYEGNYFIVEEDGVSKVIDKDNKEVLVAGDGETFEGITNNAVKVHWEKSGYYDQYYYKDMSGNKINIQISK